MPPHHISGPDYYSMAPQPPQPTGAGGRTVLPPPQSNAFDSHHGHASSYSPPPHPAYQHQHQPRYQQHQPFHHVPRPGPLDQHHSYQEPRTHSTSAQGQHHGGHASYQNNSYYSTEQPPQTPMYYSPTNVTSSTITVTSQYDNSRSDRPPSFPAPQHPNYHENMPGQVVNQPFEYGSEHFYPSKPSPTSTSTTSPRSSSSTTGTSPYTNTVASVPNLLDRDRADIVEKIRFKLHVRQQPMAARACGSGERDRRNIDPPPVVQLLVEGPGLTPEESSTYLRFEHYVMHCWIYDETGEHDESHMPTEYRYQRRLTGAQVSTPIYGRDENRTMGCFFTFPDLSVRTLGKYRLRFNLVMLDFSLPRRPRHYPNLAEAMSDVFEVYTAKEFPGIRESSRLVKSLRQQGCIIGLKKGNERNKSSKRNARGDNDDGNDDDDDDMSDE